MEKIPALASAHWPTTGGCDVWLCQDSVCCTHYTLFAQQADRGEVYSGYAGFANMIKVSDAAEVKGREIIPSAGPAGTEGELMPFDGYYFDKARGLVPEYDNKWNKM